MNTIGSPLPVVVPARAKPRVEVKSVPVLEVLGRADAADGVPPGRPHVGQPKDAALELDVGEEVRQAKVLVRELAAEHLQQVADVPGGAVHVVVDLTCGVWKKIR